MSKNKKILKSIGAVLAGFLATAIVTTLIDIGLHLAGIYPALGERMADQLFILAFAYRLVLNTGGSYLTARLAPQHPMKHALALGVIGVILSTVGAITMGDKGPAWYSLAVIFTAIPCAWAGGKLYERSAG
jgi:hypothetical protein